MAKPGAPDRITIADGEFSRESANLAAAREQACVLASDGGDHETAPPHPIVERTIAALGKAKPSDIGLVVVSQGGLISCEVAPADRHAHDRSPGRSDTAPFDVPLLGTGSFGRARSAAFCAGDRGPVRGRACVR